MEPSLRLVPSAQGGSSKVSVEDTANSLGVHDAFRHGPRSFSDEVKSGGATQQRLEKWEETQDNLKLTLQRNLYGLHMPVRQMMERNIVAKNPHMPALPQSNIHLDILMGRDETLDIVDVFGECETGPSLDIHFDMERKRRM